MAGAAGAAGAVGSTGASGATGATGSQGGEFSGGVPGPAGPAGPMGATGSVGQTGSQGVAGIVTEWDTYRVYEFGSGSATVSSVDAKKSADVAAYMTKNPSLVIGIDGYLDPNNRDLSNRRVDAVRNSLIAAGMPSRQIQIGSFGDPNMRRDGRVELLVRTGN